MLDRLARGGGAAQPFGEGTPPAGIQEEDPELAGLLQLADRQVKGHGLVDQIPLALQQRVGRYQVVSPGDLETVAREEHHRDFRAARLDSEVAQRPREVTHADVAPLVHLEPEFAQRNGDRMCVFRGPWQCRHVLVGADADDERDAVARLFRPERSRREDDAHGNPEETPGPHQPCPPSTAREKGQSNRRAQEVRRRWMASSFAFRFP
jgi:hypothetical protein